MHSHSANICLLEKWAQRYHWGGVGPRSFRAFAAPVFGWVLGQWEEARSRYDTHCSQVAWARAIAARDDYAATHGGYTREGFAIPGQVAAAARGER